MKTFLVNDGYNAAAIHAFQTYTSITSQSSGYG